jgi:hypothetical protein
MTTSNVIDLAGPRARRKASTLPDGDPRTWRCPRCLHYLEPERIGGTTVGYCPSDDLIVRADAQAAPTAELPSRRDLG